MIKAAEQSHLSVNWQAPINWRHPLNRGLVGWWLNQPSFQGGGVFRDLTGRHDGTLTDMSPATDWVRGGHPGGWGALDFDGTLDNISVPHHADLNPSKITLMFWATTRSFAGYGNYIEKNFNNGYRIRIEPAGNLRLLNQGGTNGLTTSGAMTLNKWQFVAFTGDASGFNAYIDSVFDSSGGSAFLQVANANPLHIGAGILGGNAPEYLDGQLDDVRIYNRALSSNEIAEYYQLSRQGYGGILNRWHLSQNMASPQAAAGGGYSVLRSPIFNSKIIRVAS